MELFCLKGYDAVSVQEIVDMAGVTKPTLYHYFGSKCGLLQTMLEDRMEQFCHNLQIRSEEGGDISGSLYNITSVYLDEVLDEPNFYSFVIGLIYSGKESEGYKAVEGYINRIYRIVLELFERNSGILGNMHGRQEQFAIGFVGLLNNFFLYMILKGQQKVSDDRKYSLVHQFMHGIYS